MKGTNLGELEELILLTVGILYKQAYGVAVMDEIEKQIAGALTSVRYMLCCNDWKIKAL